MPILYYHSLADIIFICVLIFSWSQIYFVAKDVLELLIFLPPSPELQECARTPF